jgi:hypothetical protein
MKRIIIFAALSVAIVAMTSCATKKRHCDAYGSLEVNSDSIKTV